MRKISLEKTPAFSILVAQYPSYFTHGKGRKLVYGKWGAPGFLISSLGEDVSVMYKEDADLFRALGLLMTETDKKELSIRQIPPIDFRSVMIDVSRNAVIKPEYLKKIIVKFSLLGINYACLYTEDTYEVAGHPLFGFNRGKYSKDEIREICAFAKKFGVTMFPCIQTLGHLEQVLKFPQYSGLKDNDKVLNVRNPKIYKFIEQMIKNAVEPYDTDLIHIGMDETHGLGTGNSFLYCTPIDPRELYLKHALKVVALCKKMKLKPMMWGDMVLGYDPHTMSKKQLKLMPKGIEMVYWNYYSEKDESKNYEGHIKTYRKFGYEPMSAAGVWNWNAIWGRYQRAERTTPVFMEITKRYGIKRAMTTMWGDDGNECPFDSNWPALILFSEHCYVAKPDPEVMKKLVKAVAGDAFEKYLISTGIIRMHSKGFSVNGDMGRSFLYDDPIFGVYAMHVLASKFKGNVNAHYDKVYKAIKAFMPGVSKGNKELFNFALALTDLLRIKAGFRNELYLAHKAGNKAKLRKLLKVVPELKKRYEAMSKAQRAIWLLERKPQGLEVLDMRYGAQLKRLDVTAERIKDYLSGKIKRISELDEKQQNIFAKFPNTPGQHYRNFVTLTTVK